MKCAIRVPTEVLGDVLNEVRLDDVRPDVRQLCIVPMMLMMSRMKQWLGDPSSNERYLGTWRADVPNDMRRELGVTIGDAASRTTTVFHVV